MSAGVAVEPLEAYERALARGPRPGAPAALRLTDGTRLPLRLDRWLGTCDAEDERLLDQALAPVLDVGCGAGRHLAALRARGVECLGVDVSPLAARLARLRGVAALERSVFDELPGGGRWGSVLLLDGNVGIGGAPVDLLRRAAQLLRPGGRVLVELDDPPEEGPLVVRIEAAGLTSRWFRWGRLGPAGLEGAAGAAGLGVVRVWRDGERSFARLDRP